MPIACLMSLEESYVRHPSCGSNAEPKVTAAAQCATKGNGVALSLPRVAFGCRRDTCSDNLLQGESAHHNLLKHCENELLPIGHGERACNQLFFYRQRRTFFTAKGRFLTVAAVVVMQSMALGMAGTTRRKTCFPTGVTDNHKKAKPTTVAMAFCIYITL